MQWDAVGAIGEVAGAAGVIITLVYLSIQLRQNTKAQRNASRLETTRSFTDWYSTVMTQPDLMRVWDEVFLRQSELSAEDRARFFWMISAVSSRVEEMYTQTKAGLIEGEVWLGHRASMAGLLDNPMVRAWWDSGAVVLSKDFRDEIEATKREETVDFRAALKGLREDRTTA